MSFINRKIIWASMAFLTLYGFLLTGTVLIALDGQYLVSAMFLACFAPALASDYKVFKEILARYKGDKF